MTLVLIGLIGGIITGLSPCVLPVLPVVFLGGGSAGPDAEPAGPAASLPVVLGLTLSFAVFTLFGSLILASLHLPDDAIRWAGLTLLLLVGLGLLVPPLGHLLERPFYRFPQRLSGTGGNGFVLGIALGAVFVPCAGPVLAAITVAGATDHIGLRTIGLTLGFAVGTAIPLLAFALAGRGLTQRLGAYRRHQGAFRAVSGVVMIVLAVALTFNISDVIQRDIPNYTQAVGNSLEKGAAAPAAGTSVSLQDCQSAALYGGSGTENCGAAPAFKGIQQWFNTPGGKPVSLASLKGKVVIVDFWAYSCINCQRELPHVEAWYKDYAADGLEVVGVQTPEYAFEHVPSNVAGRRPQARPHLPRRARQLLRHLERLRQPVLAGRVPDRRHRADPAHLHRRRRLPARGADHPATAARRAPRHRTAAGDRRPRHHPRQPQPVAGDLPRRRARAVLRRHQLLDRHVRVPASLPSDSFALSGGWTIGQQSITAGKGAAIKLAYNASYVYLDVGGTGTLTVTSRRREKGHPCLRRPRHLHRRHGESRAERYRDDQAVAGPAGLLIHLRLSGPRPQHAGSAEVE